MVVIVGSRIIGKEEVMADEFALDLEELRHLQSIAKRPRVVSLISAEINNLEKVSSLTLVSQHF